LEPYKICKVFDINLSFLADFFKSNHTIFPIILSHSAF
jgi:hypothetical protein